MHNAPPPDWQSGVSLMVLLVALWWLMVVTP